MSQKQNIKPNAQLGVYDIFLYNVFGHLTTIIICIFSYDIYILLDQYFHTIIFSILVGSSIRPIKNMVVSQIIDLIYFQNTEVSLNVITVLEMGVSSLILPTDENIVPQQRKQIQQQSHKDNNVQALINFIAQQTQQDVKQLNEGKKKKNEQKQLPQKKSKIKTSKMNKSKKLQQIEENKQQQISQIKTPVQQKSTGWQQLPTKQATFLNYIKMIINIIGLGGIMYFLKDHIGFLIIVLIFVIEFVIKKKLLKKILKKSLDFNFFQKIVNKFHVSSPKEKFRKSLSSFCSVFCIVLIILIILLMIIFSFFMVKTDIKNVNQYINNSKIKGQLVNLLENLQLEEVFNNSTLIKTLENLNVYQQAQKFLEGNQKEINNSTGICLGYVKPYIPSFFPDIIADVGCNIYTEFQFNTVSKYLNYAEDILATLNKFIGFSFGQLFGVINYFFLFIFKSFIFFTVAYYILEDFNVEDFIQKIGGLFIKKDNKRIKDEFAINFAEDFLNQLKSIMTSSLFIGFCHFLLSWIMLDVFQITNFNFIVSIFFGLMAMLPIYQPYIGAGILSILSYAFSQENHISKLIIFFFLYFVMSGRIFKEAYKSIKVPISITNLSVILGIYSYGTLGVFYGPLIVVIMKRILSLFKTIEK